MIGNVYRVKIQILAGKTASCLCAMNNLNIRTNSSSKGESVSQEKKKLLLLVLFSTFFKIISFSV